MDPAARRSRVPGTVDALLPRLAPAADVPVALASAGADAVRAQRSRRARPLGPRLRVAPRGIRAGARALPRLRDDGRDMPDAARAGACRHRRLDEDVPRGAAR